MVDCLCDDLSVCTIDTCEPKIGCINIYIDCDDYDDTTVDYCDAATGCLHLKQAERY
jgi:hypothetical protein